MRLRTHRCWGMPETEAAHLPEMARSRCCVANFMMSDASAPGKICVLPFKLARPCFAAAVLLALVLSSFWYAASPGAFDNGRINASGWLFTIIQQAPESARRLIFCGLAILFFYLFYAIYLPCILRRRIAIFDRDGAVCGFGFWGEGARIAIKSVRSVVFRYGWAVVSSDSKSVWVPLSLLKISETQREMLREHLSRLPF